MVDVDVVVVVVDVDDVVVLHQCQYHRQYQDGGKDLL
jgi:hypothetical protein